MRAVGEHARQATALSTHPNDSMHALLDQEMDADELFAEEANDEDFKAAKGERAEPLTRAQL